jgi:acylphosphatase
VAQDAPGRIRRRVTIEGRVQGVWFRESCRRQATDLGVAGWIRNCPDGRVEAVFEGIAPAVEAVVAWCRTGPPRAQVTRVDVVDERPVDADGFTIR